MLPNNLIYLFVLGFFLLLAFSGVLVIFTLLRKDSKSKHKSMQDIAAPQINDEISNVADSEFKINYLDSTFEDDYPKQHTLHKRERMQVLNKPKVNRDDTSYFVINKGY